MALIMLPCDLPWWPNVVKQLDNVAVAQNSQDLISAMLKIHDMCNISLDPDEDENNDPNRFVGLKNFIEQDLDVEERQNFFGKIIPKIVERAKALRSTKPPQGLYFSLQQQGDCVEYSYGFASSLIANAFFSTYPKRTQKTHPTLGDFNFSNFFRHLHLNSQKAKLRSILWYFDFLASHPATSLNGQIIVSRQVMSSKQWLTIEDWLESNDVPLCPLTIRHFGRLEHVDIDTPVLHICFASSKIGDGVLEDIITQETVQIATHPEMLPVILSVEALEDNEVLIVDGARHISIINNPKQKAIYESITTPKPITICCMDAENYSQLPVSQYEEDNILRELNKSLLSFRQKWCQPILIINTTSTSNNKTSSNISSNVSSSDDNNSTRDIEILEREKAMRLPINQSSSVAARPLVAKQLAESEKPLNEKKKTADVKLLSNGTAKVNKDNKKIDDIKDDNRTNSTTPMTTATTTATTRNRFIVLGSSGEILPVKRKSLSQMSVYESCDSSDDDSFHSANDVPIYDDQLDDDMINQSTGKYINQLDTPERRGKFAKKLREALNYYYYYYKSSTNSATSAVTAESIVDDDYSSADDESSNYAVEINISGGHVKDQDIKVKRGGGSHGFILSDESVDEDFLKASLEAEQKWLGKFKQAQQSNNTNNVLQRKDTNTSSKYSFSTEYSSEFCSELEEVYEQLSRWLDDDSSGFNRQNNEMSTRDKAVVNFADSILRRALSESFAGIPVQDGEPLPIDIDNKEFYEKQKLAALAIRSLSLELARQNNNNNSKNKNNHNHPRQQETFPTNSSSNGGKQLSSVATGNWGCGSRLKGDPQLKFVIQWLAASLAGIPRLIYYTCGNSNLSKLDTVSRVLTDRHWSVGNLSSAMLRFAVRTIEEEGIKQQKSDLFEQLIRVDKSRCSLHKEKSIIS